MRGAMWSGGAPAFFGMWAAMTAVMMLPSVAPVLWRYRQAAARAGARRPGVLTGIVAAAYLAVWVALGVAVLAVGSGLTAVTRELPVLARAVPAAAGIVVLIAGALQLTAWKGHHLAGCREVVPARAGPLAVSGVTAWRSGMRFGLHCGQSCAALMVSLLVLGVMDFRAMVGAGAVLAAERLLPAGERVARAIGVVVAGAGLFLTVRAGWLG